MPSTYQKLISIGKTKIVFFSPNILAGVIPTHLPCTIKCLKESRLKFLQGSFLCMKVFVRNKSNICAPIDTTNI